MDGLEDEDVVLPRASKVIHTVLMEENVSFMDENVSFMDENLSFVDENVSFMDRNAGLWMKIAVGQALQVLQQEQA